MPSVRAMRLARRWTHASCPPSTGRFNALGAGDEAREGLSLLAMPMVGIGFNALGAGDEARETTGRMSSASLATFQCPRCGR